MEIKRVYEKLNKVELKSEKVELALVDDLSKKYDSIKSDYDSQSLKATKTAQDLVEISSKCKSILKDIPQAQKIADKVAKAADDLGIGLPDEARVAVNMLDKIKSDLSKLNSATDKAADAIYSRL